MSKITAALLVLCLAASTDRAAGQAPGCSDWNAERFFRSAIPAEVEICLEFGVDLETREDEGYNPLELAAMYSSPEVAEALIRAGADVDPRPRGYSTLTPLDLAARFNGNPRMVEVLIRWGADLGNDWRYTGPARPLHWAAENDNVQVTEALIRAGAEVDAIGYYELYNPSASSDAQFASPLTVAVAKGTRRVVEALLEAGADIDGIPRWATGDGPLHFAVWRNSPELARLLIEAGADVSLRGFESTTPLGRAMNLGRSEMVRILVRAGVNMELALHRAAWFDDVETARVLIQEGADPAERNHRGDTPLHRAVSHQMAQVLLQAGADVSARNNYGDTPLHRVFDGEKIPALVQAGADLNARNNYGGTSLHTAAYGDAVRALIRAGADLTARDDRGDTPLHRAAAKLYREEVMQALIQAGADLSLVDDRGDTPLYRAVARSNESAARILLEAGAEPLAGSAEVTLRAAAAPLDEDWALELRDSVLSRPGLQASASFTAGGELDPGDTFRDCLVCPPMIVVPQGSFTMGSPASEEGRQENEGPQATVEIESPFAVGVYEVTHMEWDWCARRGECRELPGGHDLLGGHHLGSNRSRHPVAGLRWDDAARYVRWLSREAGAQYRLLREEEFEYVARAGTEMARYWGDDLSVQCRYANGDDDDGRCSDDHEYTAPVGSFEPNGFGLFDVLGNVWEWTADCWRDDLSQAPDCSHGVVRGGSWRSPPDRLRSASRLRSDALFSNAFVRAEEFSTFGLRVARNMN